MTVQASGTRPRGGGPGTFAPGPAAGGPGTLNDMTDDGTILVPAPRPRLERSRRDRVLGGVCAGIAHRLGLSSLLLRTAAVALALISAGTAVLAYLVAWIVIPPAADDRARPPARSRSDASDGGARVAWTAAAGQLRSLAKELGAARTQGERPESHDLGTAQNERTRAAAVDAAMTKLGDRLREPEVRAGAQRAAVGLAAAVGASAEELRRRGRRTPPGGDGTAS